MKHVFSVLCTIVLITSSGVLSSFDMRGPDKLPIQFPYKQAGVNERQAAAHLLNRFTYGPTPGQIDAVIKTGLEKWFLMQLSAGLADDSLKQLLSSFDALTLTNTQIINTYPKGAKVLRMAIQDGVIHKDSINKEDKKAYKDRLESFMAQKALSHNKSSFASSSVKKYSEPP